MKLSEIKFELKDSKEGFSNEIVFTADLERTIVHILGMCQDVFDKAKTEPEEESISADTVLARIYAMHQALSLMVREVEQFYDGNEQEEESMKMIKTLTAEIYQDLKITLG